MLLATNDPPAAPDASDDADGGGDASPNGRRDDPDGGDAGPSFPAPL